MSKMTVKSSNIHSVIKNKKDFKNMLHTSKSSKKYPINLYCKCLSVTLIFAYFTIKQGTTYKESTVAKSAVFPQNWDTLTLLPRVVFHVRGLK